MWPLHSCCSCFRYSLQDYGSGSYDFIYFFFILSVLRTSFYFMYFSPLENYYFFIRTCKVLFLVLISKIKNEKLKKDIYNFIKIMHFIISLLKLTAYSSWPICHTSNTCNKFCLTHFSFQNSDFAVKFQQFIQMLCKAIEKFNSRKRQYYRTIRTKTVDRAKLII